MKIPQIPVDELKSRLAEQPLPQVVDVRRRAEYRAGHAPTALNVPLDSLMDGAGSLDPFRPTVVICASGYRSSAATSLLYNRGFASVFNVVGGTNAWIAAGNPVEKEKGPEEIHS